MTFTKNMSSLARAIASRQGRAALRAAVLQVIDAGNATRDMDRQLGNKVGDDPFLPCPQAMTERWNREWLRYLAREFQEQLVHASERPGLPDLPDQALDMLDFRIPDGLTMRLYCTPDAILNKRIMEVGCGCGNMVKYLARYGNSVLGVDFSTLALKIARLVSPANCTYVHAADHVALRRHFGCVDTVLGRFFWIHQNMDMARRLLRFMDPFLATSGRIYCDFYWPAPGSKHADAPKPAEALSPWRPSVMFAYSAEDVAALIEGTVFRKIEETLCTRPDLPRRFVVLEKKER